MTDIIYSYPSVYALGHPAIENIFDNEVIIEEKVDGSQFSFAKIDGKLYCRSKNVPIDIENPIKMFEKVVETVKEIFPFLKDGYIYRCEYLEKPKHNTLEYSRVPKKYLIGFDIVTKFETYMSYPEKKEEFERIGLECVPLLFQGKVNDYSSLKNLLDTESILGKSKIEGFVVKNYFYFTREKKVALGKYVREDFKETNKKEWKDKKKDIFEILVETFKSEVRWNKARQHLVESGMLENSPRDIPLLIREVVRDTESECKDEIKDLLYKHYWPKLSSELTKGLPEWYKNYLVQSLFESKEE